MKVNNDTGEVLEYPNWNGMFSGVAIVPDDRSNHFQDQYEEVPPYTKDADGKWLNDTSQPILISKGKKDLDEYIQSFKDDVDIYKILEKVALTGDESYLFQREGFYGDTTIFPDNIHDMADKFENDVEYMRKNFTKDEINDILNDEVTAESIGEKVANRKAGAKTSGDVKTEEKTEVKEKVEKDES